MSFTIKTFESRKFYFGFYKRRNRRRSVRDNGTKQKTKKEKEKGKLTYQQFGKICLRLIFTDDRTNNLILNPLWIKDQKLGTN